MQIKRQNISLIASVFGWLVFYGIQNLVLALTKDNENLSPLIKIGLPIFLILLLIGLFLANRYLVRDDMITIKESDHKLQRIIGYIAVIPVVALIFIDYIVRDNPEMRMILTIISAGIVIIVGLFGAIYFGLLACQKPKIPFSKKGQVEDADYKDKH